MSATAFEHPFLSGLLGDADISAYLSVEADIRAMLAFEAALAEAQASADVIPKDAARRIGDICAGFEPDVARLNAATAKDGVVVPELVRQLRTAVGEEAAAYVHVGATSQDVIDTSLMLRLKSVLSLFASRLSGLVAALDNLDALFGARPLMGHTRMQAAIPITVADRIQSWRLSLEQDRDRLIAQVLPVQFGGAAGTLDRLGTEGEAVRARLAQRLGLSPDRQWQNRRGIIADIAHLLSLISGATGKIGQDIALLAQMGDEIELAGGGASSAMAHKQNPVAAETLVALARFNAVQVSGIHHALVHEQERSGAAWTLEWLIVPQMVMATGASLRLAGKLVHDIRRLGAV